MAIEIAKLGIFFVLVVYGNDRVFDYVCFSYFLTPTLNY